MKKLRVSVIGVGHLGGIHAKLWKNVANAELVGVFDTDKDRADIKAGELGCKSFRSIEECIENSDAVTIASPTVYHFEIAKKCIDADTHCFIEKPVTATYAEATRLIEQASNKNICIQVGHVERFNPALLALADYNIAPMFIEAHRLAQFKPRATDVSVIHDLMIHDLDIMLWLVKSPVKKIDANGVAVITDTPDIANARITFENGAVANLTASRISANPMRKMRIFQKYAYISIDFGKQDVEVFKITDKKDSVTSSAIPAQMLGMIEAAGKNVSIVYEKPPIPEINAIQEEQKSFADSILNGANTAVTLSEATEALRIAELINDQLIIL
jgi:predicted dehydrogenase